MTPKGIKNRRKDLHELELAGEYIGPDSRETALARTHLQSARMWLGEALGECSGQTGYTDSLDPSNEKIAAPRDLSAEDYVPPDGSRIKLIKELRVALVSHAQACRAEINTGSAKHFYKLAMSQAYVELCNARMWLGRELNNMYQSSANAEG